MSITDAFRLLNSNIRGISEDRRRHEENMQALEHKKALAEAELNSPERKLKRQQAADQLKMTEIKSFGWSPDGKSAFAIETFNKDVLPNLKTAVPDGAEVNNRGNLVWAGTEEPYMTEAWKAKKIQSELGIAFAMSNLPDKAMDREISHLEFNISDLDNQAKTQGGKLTPKQKLDKAQWNSQLTKLQSQRNNPEVYAKKLMSSNKQIQSNLEVLYQINGNPEMINNLLNYYKANNSMLASMSKEGTFKGKAFNYAITEGGKTRTQALYFTPGTEPQSIMLDGKKWQKGSVKAAPGSDKGKLTAASENTVLKDFTKFKSVLSAAQVKQDYNATIQRLVSGGHTKEEADNLWKLMKDNSSEVVKDYTELIKNYEDRYYGKAFSKDVIWKEKKEEARGETAKKQPATKAKGKTKDFSKLW